MRKLKYEGSSTVTGLSIDATVIIASARSDRQGVITKDGKKQMSDEEFTPQISVLID